MKKKLLTVALAVALVTAAPMALAQEGAAPSMVRVITVKTHLGHAQDFEAGMKKLSAIAAKNGNRDLAFVGSLTSHPGWYDLVFAMNDYGDIAEQEKRGNAMFAEMGEAMGKMMSSAASFDSAIYGWRGDLSHQPDSPRVGDGDAGFTRGVTLFPHPAHGPAVEQQLKHSMALRKKHGINDRVGVWELLVGADGPAYVVLIGGKDEADYYSNQAMVMKKMEADWQKLVAEVSPLLRKIEYSSSVPRPDLLAGSN